MKDQSWKFSRFFILFFICANFLVCVISKPSYAQMDDWLKTPYLTELLRSSQGMDQVWQSQPGNFPESFLLTTLLDPFQMGLTLDLQGDWPRPWEEPKWEQWPDMGMNMQQYVQPIISEYSRSIYQQPDIFALPGRSRNMLFDFAYQIPGQNQIPGLNTWSPSPTRIKPKQDFPLPDYWAPFSKTSPGRSPVPDVWATFGNVIVWGGYGGSLGLGGFTLGGGYGGSLGLGGFTLGGGYGGSLSATPGGFGFMAGSTLP